MESCKLRYFNSFEFFDHTRYLRTGPRMGEQTFRLTNIVRADPSPSLFTVPADFKTVDGQPVLCRAKP